MAKTRNYVFDIVKGLGMILIITAHGTSPVMGDNELLRWFYLIIYNVVLAPFVFISGYFSTKLVTKPIPKLELFKQRASRLMIPYCVWAVIYLPMKFLMSDYVRYKTEYKWYSFFLGNNPDGQLWFLYVMFIAAIIMLFLSNTKNITTLTIVFMLLSVFAPAIPFEIGFTSIALNRSLYQLGFFFLGAFVALKCDYKKILYNIPFTIISTIVVAGYCILMWFHKETIWYIEAIVSICCICVSFNIGSLLSKTKLNKGLAYIGQKSMDIYILHGPLLVICRIVLTKLVSNTYVYLILTAAICTGVSLLLSFVINKIKIARFLLFGAK